VIVAVHHREKSFSDQWIKYLEDNHIDYKLVDAYANNIIEELKKTDAFLWHFRHDDERDSLFAKQLFLSLSSTGIKTFPADSDGWFYDDKLGQKYLLEARNVFHAPLYVFYDKEKALDWLKNSSYPKVFKLRTGAGSSSVFLISNYKQGQKIVRKSFGKGIGSHQRFYYVNESLYKIKNKQKKSLDLFRALGKSIFKNKVERISRNETGYALFQDFIPNEGYDIRVVVVYDRAYCARRENRKGDFRASGSGHATYPDEKLPVEFIESAFDTAKRLETKCLAIDLIKNKEDGKVYVIEVSHAYAPSSLKPCKGYWSESLNWTKSNDDPQYYLMERYVKEIQEAK
jgi:glutathione synthase/RimK-type ligase-like ATP-grasp enzyme